MHLLSPSFRPARAARGESLRRRVARPWLLALALAFPMAEAIAQDAARPAAPAASTWSLGVGILNVHKPYTGVGRETKALPLLRFENEYVHFFGTQLGVKLPGLDLGSAGRVDSSVILRYDGSGYEAEDAPILGGMQERKGGLWAGLETRWKTGAADVKAAWSADVSSHSKGQRLSLGLEKTWRVGDRMMLTPRIEATWSDKKYVDYYFGVRNDEVRAGRPAYVGRSGAGAELGVRGLYMIDARQGVVLDLAVASLPKAARDSPLVDRSTQDRVFLGYTYRFR